MQEKVKKARNIKRFLIETAIILLLSFGILTGILYGSGSTWNNVYSQYKTNLIMLEAVSGEVNQKVTFDEKIRLYIRCFAENIHYYF